MKQLKEDNTGENMDNLGDGNDFLDTTQKLMIHEGNRC